MSSIIKSLVYTRFAIRTSWPIWWNILNRTPRALFAKNTPTLDDTQRRLVEGLKKDGIVATTLDELFPGQHMLATLQAYAKSLEPNAKSRTKKLFLKHYWDITPQLDLNNPFIAIIINKRIVDIANSYMEMWTKLKYYTLIETTPVGGEDAVQSQRWHRDPEEKRMCKMFIYLTDVDEESGPFIYTPQSVYGKKYGHLFPQRPPEGIYPPEEAVSRAIPKEDVRVFTGKAGTVLFCDTTGIHRGGYARSKPRLMFTAFFSAPTFSEPTRYTHPQGFAKTAESLDPAVRYTLEP